MCIKASGIVVYAWRDEAPRFLLLENARHRTWGFPKGHLEEGEDLSTGAARECREETGLEIQAIDPSFMKTTEHTYVPKGTKEPRLKRTHYFLSPCESEEVSLSMEHTRLAWDARIDARARLQFDNLREVLDCAYTSALERAHQEHPDARVAEMLLFELSGEGDLWRQHCLKVGEIARRIAEGVVRKRPDLPVDPETVQAQALVHDIGRSRDQGMGHPGAGMALLIERGLVHLAKPCISHWLKGRKRSYLARDPFFSPSRLDELYRHFDLDVFTVSEKIVSVADSLVQHATLVRLEERYLDARERYGDSRWMRDNEQITAMLIRELEGYLSSRLYTFLQLE